MGSEMCIRDRNSDLCDVRMAHLGVVVVVVAVAFAIAFIWC